MKVLEQDYSLKLIEVPILKEPEVVMSEEHLAQMGELD
eukprot:CAMPEP_0170546720 /NCGR_PEP_ID=MMETSP0211-20121228/5057_1 /TAXON_ID=311385 /ORGANISM="Pseudokeronopsis sp., Strain OXSARD2" /LENGTH=37 /DNA_ID= /DNA_START= /DNA_END= /DNA_ORIENTATION=